MSFATRPQSEWLKTMARAIWSGSISFGLLNVPVKLYSAVSKKSVSFRELRESDGSRIRHKRVAEADGEEVPYEDIVKGYEIAPEQYVVITRDELEELDPKKTRAIEIQDFVDLDDIDPIYFDHPYYLGPDKGAEKAYALLVKAMADAHKVAIARFVLRNREHLAALRPMGDVLTHGDDALRRRGRLARRARRGLPEDGREPEEEGARHGQAADRLAHLRLRPEQVPRRVPRGAAGADRAQGPGRGRGQAVSEEPKPTKAPDLMAALEESLAAVKGEPLAAGAKAKTAPPSERKAPSRPNEVRPARNARQDLARASRDREARPRPRK